MATNTLARPRPWILTPIGVTASAMVLIVLTAIPIRSAVQTSVGATKLRKALAAASNAGIPLESSELRTPPLEPKNAASFIREAIAALPNDGYWTSRFSYDDYASGAKTSSGPSDEARKAVNSLQPALQILRRAANRPSCDFGYTRDYGPNVLFPELAGMKKLAKAATFSAYVRALKGDARGALNDIAVAASLARFAAQGPGTVCASVAIAIDSIWRVGAEQCLALTKSPSEAWEYGYVLERTHLKLDIVEILKAEAYVQMVQARNAHLLKGSEEEDPTKRPYENDLNPDRPVDRKALASVLTVWSDLFQQIKGKDDAEVRRLVLEFETSPKTISRLTPEVRQLFAVPFFKSLFDAMDRDLAGERCTLALAKAMEYKLEHGSFPSSLQDVSANFTDPFTDEPLRYQRRGDGAVVYSLGIDRKDDGGIRFTQAPDPSTRSGMSYDIVAAYPPFTRAGAAVPVSQRPR